jgi:MSHA biogenesis protein MshL
MRTAFALACAALMLAACQSPDVPRNVVQEKIAAQVGRAAEARPAGPPPPAAVSQALLPPLTVELPAAAGPLEPRFDLSVTNAPANQVFMALVSGTRYSMLVHPEVKEPISITLKDVTLPEALDAIREVYGYEYRIEGTRVFVQPVAMQTRLFRVNYLMGRRQGRADVRVNSGSIQAAAPGAAAAAAPVTPGLPPAPAPATANGGHALESSRVTTTSDNDFWPEVLASVRSIIGEGGGRTVVVNPHAGVVMVRAMPGELRTVEQYLRAMSLEVERQVMLEAKIIEVTLSDQFATGINWAAFTGGAHRLGAGPITPGTTLRTDGTLSNPILAIDPRLRTMSVPTTAPGAMFGLAFQATNFAALLNFLESQGTVHVLSSPRIATLNNQKAVIKVGTDEFFVTNVTTTTTATGATTVVSPTITTQPFFSGIALDVTPQISEGDKITLHIKPSVSEVTDRTKVIDLGTLGTFQLPLASSTINESDTIVRVHDGTIAAIGGLMRQEQRERREGLPGTTRSPVLGTIFGSRSQQLTKTELVILLKVTVIRGEAEWQAQAQQLNERLQHAPRGIEPAR